MLVIVLNVIRDAPGVEAVNLVVSATGCLHEYQLRPQDVVALTRADVFVVNGAGMEPFREQIARRLPELPIIDASEGIELIRDDGHEPGGRGQPNPHVWVSPSLQIRQARHIAAELGRRDPARAEIYRQGAEGYAAALAVLRDRIGERLKDVANRNVVTFHRAFSYFAAEFGLNVVAVMEADPGSEPSAREIAQIIDAVRAHGVRALFAEPQYPARAAEAVSRETGARVYVLDPGVTGPASADAYLECMARNLDVLCEALRRGAPDG
jgi:zinc transport system substrate-binding protein